jgi:hypothetical protein
VTHNPEKQWQNVCGLNGATGSTLADDDDEQNILKNVRIRI